MKWTLLFLNLVAIFALYSVNQYAHGHHRAEVEWAYEGLVKAGLLDEAKAEEFARLHNGWHPRNQLERIGNPDVFVQIIFIIGAGACVFNSIAILVVTATKKELVAKPEPLSPL